MARTQPSNMTFGGAERLNAKRLKLLILRRHGLLSTHVHPTRIEDVGRRTWNALWRVPESREAPIFLSPLALGLAFPIVSFSAPAACMPTPWLTRGGYCRPDTETGLRSPRGHTHWRRGSHRPHHPSCAPGKIGQAHMGRRTKSQSTWIDVSAKLAGIDRSGLLGLVHDLYAAHKDNKTFLHARLGIAEDVLAPYKETMDRWLWPDMARNQGTSVARAKQAISGYRKAVGDPAGLAELMVFYCEKAAGFCVDIASNDEKYLAALVRMFEQALTATKALPVDSQDALVARMARVCSLSQKIGYGVGEDMEFLLTKYANRRQAE